MRYTHFLGPFGRALCGALLKDESRHANTPTCRACVRRLAEWKPDESLQRRAAFDRWMRRQGRARNAAKRVLEYFEAIQKRIANDRTREARRSRAGYRRVQKRLTKIARECGLDEASIERALSNRAQELSGMTREQMEAEDTEEKHAASFRAYASRKMMRSVQAEAMAKLAAMREAQEG
jgi:hypothetical protein